MELQIEAFPRSPIRFEILMPQIMSDEDHATNITSAPRWDKRRTSVVRLDGLSRISIRYGMTRLPCLSGFETITILVDINGLTSQRRHLLSETALDRARIITGRAPFIVYHGRCSMYMLI